MISGFAGLVVLGKPVLKINAERARAHERAEHSENRGSGRHAASWLASSSFTRRKTVEPPTSSSGPATEARPRRSLEPEPNSQHCDRVSRRTGGADDQQRREYVGENPGLALDEPLE